MNAKSQARLLFTFALAMLLVGCQQDEAAEPAEPATSQPASTADKSTQPLGPLPTLALQVAERTGDAVVVDLVYAPDDGAEGPRAVELWMTHSSHLTYESATPLAAVEAAGKTLVVQPKEGAELRTILYSAASLETIGAGPLVRYRFRVTKPGAATVEIMERMPIFAPAAANQGLMLPKPLVVGGG